MEKKSLGKFIAILRKAKGLTQKELAELLNVSDKAVSRWERDESAPDITLIPVLAELFDVTCDELLRGERSSKESLKETPEKREHRMNVLINKSRHRFFAFSLISVGLTGLGFLFAIVCNSLLHMARLGFYCALGCFLVAGIAQAAVYFIFTGEIETDKIENKAYLEYKRQLRDTSLRIGYGIIIALAICLPLFQFGKVSFTEYMTQLTEIMGLEYDTGAGGTTDYLSSISIGIQPKTWLLYGSIYGATAAVLCGLSNFLVRYFDMKSCRFQVTEEDFSKECKNLLRGLRYTGMLVIILVLTFGCSRLFQKLATNFFLEGTVHESYDDFTKCMETVPKDMWKGTADLRKQLDKYHRTLYGDQGELLCEYTLYNDSVIHIEYGANNKLPITTYTEEDYLLAKQKADDLMWIWSVIAVLESAIVFVMYFARRKLH